MLINYLCLTKFVVGMDQSKENAEFPNCDAYFEAMQSKKNLQKRGVIPHLVDDGLSILQYADDTIIFLDHELEQAKKYETFALCF